MAFKRTNMRNHGVKIKNMFRFSKRIKTDINKYLL